MARAEVYLTQKLRIEEAESHAYSLAVAELESHSLAEAKVEAEERAAIEAKARAVAELKLQSREPGADENVQWACALGDSIADFSPEITMELENAFQKYAVAGGSADFRFFKFSRKRLNYEADFENMIQVNEYYLTQRPIQRNIIKRGGASAEQMWNELAQSINNEEQVRRLFQMRMNTPRADSRILRLDRAIKVMNKAKMANFATGTGLYSDPIAAIRAGGDAFLFHGSPGANTGNIQAEGLSMSHANQQGMLGRGLYGAPDPRKSAHYSNSRQPIGTTNECFMFVCRFNLSDDQPGPARHAKNETFDEFCVYDASRVVVLWLLKCTLPDHDEFSVSYLNLGKMRAS